MKDNLSSFHDMVQSASLNARGRSIQKRKSRDVSQPAAKWVSPALIGDKQGTALAIVLNTIGCSHARSDIGGCTMCSYLLDGSGTPVSTENLVKQFTSAMSLVSNNDGPLTVKLYTSGSFLDTSEVSENARAQILKYLAGVDSLEEVVIESRPEFITEKTTAELREALGDHRIELGVGLESSNDWIRTVCINKGFTLSDFQKALSIALYQEIGIRAYVLIKPPFMTERDALLDACRTIKDAVDMGVTTISVNPVNVQKNTLVEQLWSKGEYRTPWLWTVVDVLSHSRRSVDARVPIVCDPVAAGKARGTHNCGLCDGDIVKSIREFSLTQNHSLLEGYDCHCKSTWAHALEHEDVSLLPHG